MQRSALKTTIKKFRAAVDTGDREAVDVAFRQATKKLDQAAAKNLIHRNKAARTKSRLASLCRATDGQATDGQAPETPAAPTQDAVESSE